ncbi:MAG TPA: alpha-L-fucosidase [Candidatus Angelobacter sp.]|nr:alpha-L-fucosidase [Candidatus Angelobacter sp.]
MKSIDPYIRILSRCLAAASLVAVTSCSSIKTPPPATASLSNVDTNDPAAMWKALYGPSHEARMQWWREARFGMFIHWGVYSVPAGTYHGQQSKHIGEWIMRDFNIPVAEYAAYARQFDPTNFNADEWVKIAKDAGMKYIVITAKHHDGFAMFHTHTDGYNIYDATPWKHDPIKELSEAARKAGLKFGVYYSEAQDWHHPGGAAAKRNADKNIDAQNHWDPAQQGSMDDYINNVAVPQVKELLSNYGPISVLWWDTPVGMTPERVAKFLPLLKLQPAIITNNRLDSKKTTGDYETPEQKIPANGIPGKDWETCMTMNGTWGYKSFDHNWKSTETLLHNLIDIASKGGNYLLNVGPTSQGIIPEPSVERLKQIGAWMKVNGESIYDTTASPFPEQPAWGRCTKRVTKHGATLYLHVFDWPADGKLIVPAMEGKVVSAKLLANGTTLPMSVNENGELVLTLPSTAPDKISSTIKLEIKGSIQPKA